MRITLKVGNNYQSTFGISEYGKYRIPQRMNKENRKALFSEMILQTIKDGLLEGGAGKYINVDKDVVYIDGVIKIKNINILDFKKVHISARMTPYEIGKLTAENIFRGNDRDPVRKKYKVWKHKIWDNERIENWVLNVKLPNNPVEWQEVNSLYGDDYKRKINTIVNSIIFASIYPNNALGDPMSIKQQNEYESISQWGQII